jgi:predicted house-cleaning noncanonical NTP pyrophosphatase (MazG superfamily)
MPTKEKLVRDKIPDVMSSAGVEGPFRVAAKGEMLQLLLQKLDEECVELQDARNIEECADVFEVLLATAKELGFSLEDIQQAAQKKRVEKGGFDKGYVLRLP